MSFCPYKVMQLMHIGIYLSLFKKKGKKKDKNLSFNFD